MHNYCAPPSLILKIKLLKYILVFLGVGSFYVQKKQSIRNHIIYGHSQYKRLSKPFFIKTFVPLGD